ncbi:hypothetical protein Tco_0023074, partial [Tanacetum coccineum]
MLQICHKLPDQKFDELPFEEEMLTFLRDSKEIKVITDVNVNKLHQPWRSFAAVINKCLSASVKKKQSGSDKTKTPPTAKGKRLKTSAKAAKPAKTSKAKGLTVGSGANEGTSGTPGVPDVPTYESDDEQISWKSSDEEDDDDDNDDGYDGQDDEGQDDDNEQTDSDNDGDDF